MPTSPSGTAAASGTPQPTTAHLIPSVPPAAESEVAFISGITAAGTVAMTAYYSWDGDTPATFTPPYDQTTKWNPTGAATSAPGTAGGTVKFYFDPASNWTASEKADLEAGLALWSAEANVSFLETATASQANFTFKRGTDGNAATHVEVPNPAQYGARTIPEGSNVVISIDTSVAGFGVTGSFSQYGGYGWTTLIHEEGHMLGLGHAGPYNGKVDAAVQQFSPYDSWQYSLMSYIRPDDQDTKYYMSSPTPGTQWVADQEVSPTTPMILDIAAIQRLYGAPTTTPLSGGQTFGFHDNIVGPVGQFFNFNINTHPVVTLWDKGSGNTLDVSGFISASNVNLNAGAFSSVNLMRNDIGIAYGTKIDTAISGPGPDALVANNDGDRLSAGAGNDFLTGGTGNDTLTGGPGIDEFILGPHSGSDVITDFTLGQDFLDLQGVAGMNSLSDVLSHATQAGADSVISFPGGGQVTLDGISLANLPSAYFIYPIGGAGNSGGPGSARVDDFNGDGKADIIFRAADGSLTELASQLGGLPVKFLSLGPQSPSMHLLLAGSAQDFNGDGKADLLFRGLDGSLQLWLSNAAGDFNQMNLGPSAGASQVVGAGDFDGDGRADIVWRDASGDIQIQQSPASGGSAKVDLGVIDPAFAVQGVADFSGDGRPDILLHNDATGDTQLMLSNGQTLVGAPVDIGAQTSDWHVAGVGDFDGDGRADILWRSEGGQDSLWLSTGATGSFRHVSLPSMATSWTVQEVADLNGDGRADILWRYPDGMLRGWVAGADGTTFGGMSFPITGPGLQILPTVRIADANGDGLADVIAYKPGGALQAWDARTSPGGFAGQPLSGFPAPAAVLLPGQLAQDYNLDGRADLLVKMPAGDYGLVLSGPSKTYSFQELGAGISGMVPVAAADFNGDGDADILWRNPTSGDASVWVSNGGAGPPSFTTARLGNVAPGWALLAAGDFTGDGMADILWRDGGGHLSLWQSGLAAMSFTKLSLGSEAVSWQLAGAADFNGDGKLDLLWQNPTTGQLQLWTSTRAAGAYSQATVAGMGSGWSIVETNDFTGDGRADILWRDGQGHTALWATQAGATPSFVHYAGPTISTDWHIV